jgi:hypothetical protein
LSNFKFGICLECLEYDLNVLNVTDLSWNKCDESSDYLKNKFDFKLEKCDYNGIN